MVRSWYFASVYPLKMDCFCVASLDQVKLVCYDFLCVQSIFRYKYNEGGPAVY